MHPAFKGKVENVLMFCLFVQTTNIILLLAIACS